MKILRIALTILMATSFALGLVACREEGAFEKAGKAVDQAAEDAEDELEEAKKKLE
jgi:hypothetical protein